MSRFITIQSDSQAIVREKMSKFIAIAMPVSSAEEARQRIAQVANEYHDARHVAWAYMLGADFSLSQCNDNGEPSGTAGRPILGQIRSLGLTNVAVAVVRYFGGIKLGTSGLIVAYREAARQALEGAEIVEGFETERISVQFPYLSMQQVMKIAKGGEVRVVEQNFDNLCQMVLEIRADRADELRRRLGDVEGASVI